MKLITFIFVILFFVSPLEAEEGLDLFLKRHSGRTYDPSKEITQDQIQALIQAARWAPSSHNDQPWNYIICHKTWTKEAYYLALSSLKERQKRWVKDAPLLMIIVARKFHLHDGSPNYWAEYDSGASAVSMALQAVSLGLMAHQIGGFDKEKVKRDFHLPENSKPMAIMVIGYESPEEGPTHKPRIRRPVEENFFLGTWNNGFNDDLRHQN